MTKSPASFWEKGPRDDGELNHREKPFIKVKEKIHEIASSESDESIAFRFNDLVLALAREARQRDHIADVLHARGEQYQTLKAESPTSVRHGAKSA